MIVREDVPAAKVGLRDVKKLYAIRIIGVVIADNLGIAVFWVLASLMMNPFFCSEKLLLVAKDYRS